MMSDDHARFKVNNARYARYNRVVKRNVSKVRRKHYNENQSQRADNDDRAFFSGSDSCNHEAQNATRQPNDTKRNIQTYK